MDSRRWRVAGTQVHESIDGEMVEQTKLKGTVAHRERALWSPAGICLFLPFGFIVLDWMKDNERQNFC